jgi:hypothetical protein
VKLPNFFLLGVSKAGTTSLHHYLSQHPDVAMSEPKEPAFFRAEYERGLDYYWTTYFSHYGGQAVAGDGAPQNLYLPFVARRIHAAVPEARLAVICRDPVDRAIAAYWHSASRDRGAAGFDDAVARNLDRLSRGVTFESEAEAGLYAQVAARGYPALVREFGFLVEPGYYAQHIERYRRLFGHDRLKVLFFEDLQRDAVGVVSELLAFLGLPAMELRDTSVQNPAASPSAARAFQIAGKLPGLARVPPEWRRSAKRLLGTILRGSKPPKPQVSRETRERLAAHFRPHNQRLSEITGRDLSHWGREPSVAAEEAD